ncbi:MAG: hypothetical protein ACD_60C00029G0013 [uncultured bacterium]|nr:MAG: hypothetical protein ACD_60C00029G0013 [uncultured bacterium]
MFARFFNNPRTQSYIASFAAGYAYGQADGLMQFTLNHRAAGLSCRAFLMLLSLNFDPDHSVKSAVCFVLGSYFGYMSTMNAAPSQHPQSGFTKIRR